MRVVITCLLSQGRKGDLVRNLDIVAIIKLAKMLPLADLQSYYILTIHASSTKLLDSDLKII